MHRGIATAIVLLAGSTVSADVLQAHAGPANNGGSPNWAIFFNLEALAGPVTVTHMTTASGAAANAAFTVEVFIRDDSALGGPVTAGPGSSTAGWTSIGTAPATQGPVASQVSLTIDIPDITVPAGQVRGVAVRFTGSGPRYIDQPTLVTFQDANLKLTTGDSRSAPFTATGSFFSPRALVGSLTYTTAGASPCYPNCDSSTTAPILNVQDFGCFLNRFAAADTYANCDNSTVAPVLNVQDFACFLNSFAVGCS